MKPAATSSPPLAGRPILWQANPGPQTRFLASTATEVLYGGAAGGGKSSGLIALPLRWLSHPRFRALVLRRETTQLGDLLDKAETLYPKLFPGAEPKSTGAGVLWRFPSGASIWFNHCQRETDAAKYDGFEFQLVEFDELTHFTRKQYLAVRARIRSPHAGLPRYTRSTSNPGGEGHEWVKYRWGPWLDPEFEAPGLPVREDPETGERLPPALPGEVLWYVPSDDGDRWVPKGTPGALSRTFIPALAADNPHLLDNDPEYLLRLGDLDRVRREQLLRGNWLITEAPGELFQRPWFEIVDAAPAEALRVRAWDLAATEPHATNPDPDWTRGVRWALSRDGIYYIEDVASGRHRPHGMEKLVVQTANLDGRDVAIELPLDPAQAGKFEVAALVSALRGFNVHARKIVGDKVSRARPMSAQAEAGNIKLVRGPWNLEFLREMERFPARDAHDDQVDAGSLGFEQVTMAAARCRWVRRAEPAGEVG